MSIVERALKKAQAKKPKTEADNEPQASAPPASQPRPEHVARESARTVLPGASAEEPAVARETSAALRSSGGRVEIDVKDLRAQGRLAPENLAHQTEEEFRRIKWPVLNTITGREGAETASNNVVLVTSAIPGEGKTFNALNLALSMAREPDLSVLLVDGDVAQPALTASLGLSMKAGLTDLISDPGLDAPSVVYETSVPKLYVVPAGSRRDNSPELLASSRMESILADFSRRASPGVVIFDSPPILATNEAQVLSRYAGQIVMVVLADATEQRVVTEALSLIDRTKPVNAVLNRVEPSLVSRYYSHYYYGYGRGNNG